MTQRSFVLAEVTTQDLVELGARVRRCAEDRELARDAIAQRIVDEIWAALTGGSPPGLALVRIYRDGGLVATRGIEPVWNDVAARDEVAIGSLVGEAITTGELVHVADAIGSPRIQPQRELVLRYGVRSVVAQGGALPDGGFALVLVTRTLIAPELATALGTLAIHAGLALAGDLDPAFRARWLERVLRFDELVLIRRTTLLEKEVATLRARAAELEREVAAEAEDHARGAQRAQRGMLNVIEDLREARTALERRVLERTADLQRANEELLSTNAELEQFAYIASHDLQEPLRTIAGYLQLIEERYGHHLDAEGHEFIGFAISGAQRLQELIEALLVYSRVARAPFDATPVSLDRALDEALEATARAVAESGAVITRAPLPVVRGDGVQLRQLFQNLLSNSIKFHGEQPPRIEIAARRDDDLVALTVRDHGIGFDPRYAEQIFKVFRRLQRKQPGTGIGLAICKKIAERHGGSIRALSQLGDGAMFEVTLPAG